ncbi:hypothetical protein CHT91_03010 [Cutibacterium avidum]|uniref:Antitoxin HicB n=2 Tax=Cutibacterium avidum TaxID=33010 RepID=A0A3E2DMC3_9ACTN|nr:hypothetical protein CHT91_03010 [Cutibacterium avidum]
MAMSRTFTVTAERGRGNWWVLECPEVGAVSQVRRLDQAADEMVEAISWLADLPADEVEVRVEPVAPEGYAEHMEASRRAAAQADAARAVAARESRQAAAVLRDAGLTMRDVGSLMGVSYQRASQLVGH